MPSIAELKVIRRIAGNIVELVSHDEVELECEVLITGKYTPGRLDGPMEDCYPAEYPDVEFIGARTVAAVDMYDSNGVYRQTLPAGTEVGHELDANQADYLMEVSYDEATA